VESVKIIDYSIYGIVPEKHIMLNNKLANKITTLTNKSETELVVSSKNARREITTTVTVSYESDEERIFTPFDREVYDAVVTLYVAKNEIFTPAMVYRAMNGMASSEKVSEKAIKEVTQSIDKSRYITLKIDFSKEAKAYKKDCKATYEGYLLACEEVSAFTGGHTKGAYKFSEIPILYRYAQVSGQIFTIPIDLLQTKGIVRSTKDVIVIRGYLLRQIKWMKSSTSKRRSEILYEGIYAELDISSNKYSNCKEKIRKIREHAKAILSGWVVLGYIKDYVPYGKGKNIKGISVTV
jgi:hypothetical protein